ncbi:acyl-CoA-binding protein [Wenzhouxiangella sp. XN24]|uniref:acyl-CoA-binding protein n=1 Tax=Wenzhouxiangella sp. XN24 TaxID=2713569 RepID=UPI0013ECD2BA|nr:acyl-CoA-binding protein [Wenzhouxiangella sp. XN24]NGX16558.1 acyl-CoA-binding protein [Wenzhouxiangella sp. XN24]
MTDELKARFEQASIDIKALDQRPSDNDMLALYALYKQATEGDASGDKPGFFDFVARAKYEAWEGLQGTSAEEAMQRYIDKVRSLGA